MAQNEDATIQPLPDEQEEVGTSEQYLPPAELRQILDGLPVTSQQKIFTYAYQRHLTEEINRISGRETAAGRNEASRDTVTYSRQDTIELEKSLIKQTVPCDGSIPSQVRAWMADIDLCITQCSGQQARPESLHNVITRTITGSLRRDIERYLDGACNQQQCLRHEISWDQIRRHVTQAFLSPNEEDHLRDELESMKQSPFETVASFNRRFSEAVDLAYPNMPRNNAEQRVILKAYEQGLTSDQLVRDIMRMMQQNGLPKTFRAAMQCSQDLECQSDEYRRLGRKEQKMSIDHVQHKEDKITTVQKQQTTSKGRGRGRRNQPIQCYECSGYGHIARECVNKIKKKYHQTEQETDKSQKKPLNM